LRQRHGLLRAPATKSFFCLIFYRNPLHYILTKVKRRSSRQDHPFPFERFLSGVSIT
jgi:hypothetical protein